jgi:DNA-binding NtrC family response regulator
MSCLQILVACSDPARRCALVETLAQFGLEPVIAADMSEVRAVFSQHPLHLVICEDGLPEGGFREVLRLAIAVGSEVPVVVCSSLGEMDQYVEAMELGAFDFIAPPYRRREVEFILNSVREKLFAETYGRNSSLYPSWSGLPKG